MSVVIVDRRHEPSEDKFGISKKRFFDRYRHIIKEAVHKHVADGGIRDFENGGAVIPIPKKIN